jgi:anti-sigma regulatory factor (Ser/Thr protein kinase)
LSIPARLQELSLLREAIFNFTKSELDETDQGRVILAIDEAVTNVIAHGYNYDESKKIDIEMVSTPDSFTFIISDNAFDYNPLDSTAPDIDNYHDNGLSSGLGVDIYRRIMNVRYERKENGGNRLILVKEKKA